MIETIVALSVVSGIYLLMNLHSLCEAHMLYYKYFGLSKYSRKMMKRYLSLPKESRPVPDLYSVLKELDSKYSKSTVNSHLYFGEYGYGFDKGPNHPKNCGYEVYHEFHDAMREVEREVAKRRKIEAEKAAEHGTEMANEVAARLRQEAEVLRETRLELM